MSFVAMLCCLAAHLGTVATLCHCSLANAPLHLTNIPQRHMWSYNVCSYVCFLYKSALLLATPQDDPYTLIKAWAVFWRDRHGTKHVAFMYVKVQSIRTYMDGVLLHCSPCSVRLWWCVPIRTYNYVMCIDVHPPDQHMHFISVFASAFWPIHWGSV